MSAAFSSHLRVTLASVSHLRLVGEPHTAGCLPMCRPLIHCTAVFIAKMSYAWRASRRDLRDPGRGDPGFGAAEWSVLLDTFFFSVPRLCGSRQVVAHCRADERIVQMQLLCPALGSQKWRKDYYAVQCQVRPKRKPKKTKAKSNKARTTQKHQKPLPTAETEESLQGAAECFAGHLRKIVQFCWCFVFVSLQDPNSEASAAPWRLLVRAFSSVFAVGGGFCCFCVVFALLLFAFVFFGFLLGLT